MGGTGTMVRWLERLTEADLTVLLARRPDVLTGVLPRDLTELAQRLQHPESLVRVLRSMSVPCLQLVEAASALGAGTTRGELADFLGGGRPEHRAEVDQVVDELVELAVLCIGDGEAVYVPAAVAALFPSPLGLGPPLRTMLRDLPLDAMRRIQSKLGVPTQRNRADTVAGLIAHLGNAETVRAIVANAPAEVRERLSALAGHPRYGADGADHTGFVDLELYYDDDLSDDIGDRYDESLYDPPHYDPLRYRQEQAAIAWASERGLMLALQYSYGWRMPAEVGRALRGPDYRAPFAPSRPTLVVRAVDGRRREADSAAAATVFADHVLALLDLTVRAPIACLKSGGVGARELARLAKVLAIGEIEVRLALELADAAGLLVHTDTIISVSHDFARWRDDDPGERFVTLLTAWWDLEATPTQTRDADDKPLRALARPGRCAGCRDARLVVIQTLAGVDGASDAASIAAVALWQRPLAHVMDEDVPFATVLREAELLGVLAQGAVSALGHALIACDVDALRSQAALLLPKSTDTATFGADLTVYVAGAPSARVSALLDSAADREGRGGAIIWRFSPASVRRAFDDGMTGDALAAGLAAIATAELPQPLRYLLADVARRHGNIRLSSVRSCVRSDDEALLAEVAADRKLTKLGLRLLAPTVLASDLTVQELLVALRKAGYLPVSEDEPDNVISLSDGRARSASVERSPARQPGWSQKAQRVDPSAVAASLYRRRSPTAKPTRAELSTEHALAKLTRSLSMPEIRQLAHAIETQTRVAIDYESATGSIIRRVIHGADLSGGSLFAWCELRNDDRVFTVSRIRSVTAV